jgi:hypothetical protein
MLTKQPVVPTTVVSVGKRLDPQVSTSAGSRIGWALEFGVSPKLNGF